MEWTATHGHPLDTAVSGAPFDDLAPLAAMIGDARLVGLGESTHGTREIFQMKHRLFEYLVEELDFTTFGIEASFPECVAINRYVEFGEGDPAAALHGQGFWTWDTVEVLDLIRWMRAYNERPDRKTTLRFYGFDMQNGAPAAEYALTWLRETEGASDRLAALEADLAAFRQPGFNQSYADLEPDAKTALTAAVEGLVAHYEANRDALVAATNERDYDLAHRHAEVARQNEELIRVTNEFTGRLGMAETRRIGQAHRGTVVGLMGYFDQIDSNWYEATGRAILEPLDSDPDTLLQSYLGVSEDLQKAAKDRAKHISERLDEERATYTFRAGEDAWADARRQAEDLEKFFVIAEDMRRSMNRGRQPNIRDHYMAINSGWILDREGPGSSFGPTG